MFKVYIETSSDFAVRDWLKVRSIPSPTGQAVWKPSTICKLLTNRRYVGDVELNRANKGVNGLSDFESYQVIPAPHDAIVSKEVFETAQAIRAEKGAASPNRRGKPRDYSQNQCNRVFPLQGRLYCGVCGHAMSPYYVVHKPDGRRRSTSYVFYYVSSNQMMRGVKGCGHSNRVLAKNAEGWIVDRVSDLASNPHILDEAFAMSRSKYERDVQPQREALSITQKALTENKAKADAMLATIGASGISPELLAMLNERAGELRRERNGLLLESRKLESMMQPLQEGFDALPLHSMLSRVSTIAQAAEPLEMQRILLAAVHKMEWLPEGDCVVDFYSMPTTKEVAASNEQSGDSKSFDLWLERNVRNGSP